MLGCYPSGLVLGASARRTVIRRRFHSNRGTADPVVQLCRGYDFRSVCRLGHTAVAAIRAGRNSISVDIEGDILTALRAGPLVRPHCLKCGITLL